MSNGESPYKLSKKNFSERGNQGCGLTGRVRHASQADHHDWQSMVTSN